MDENLYKDAIKDLDWVCYDPNHKKVIIHQTDEEDICETCSEDKAGFYINLIEGWVMLADKVTLEEQES